MSLMKLSQMTSLETMSMNNYNYNTRDRPNVYAAVVMTKFIVKIIQSSWWM